MKLLLLKMVNYFLFVRNGYILIIYIILKSKHNEDTKWIQISYN